ncbi:magnesium transporter [Phyllosticta citrichinensis]|uniref:Magnesium transporter n=1 Tax=Phyllosticta citrichinensis TaxID=1130410 RepID=A0ABR1XUP8_9PEZI
MAILPNLLTVTGLLFLTHAVYSAHEHSTLYATSATAPSLPLDIVFETLISVLLACAGIISASPALKPIRWARWAGAAEREEARRRLLKGMAVQGAGEVPLGNPWAWVTGERMGFWDGREKRREFADWVRGGGKI